RRARTREHSPPGAGWTRSRGRNDGRRARPNGSAHVDGGRSRGFVPRTRDRSGSRVRPYRLGSAEAPPVLARASGDRARARTGRVDAVTVRPVVRPALGMSLDAPQLGRRALTAVPAALLVAFGPAPGDAAVHLYRTFLVRSGALIWDNFWYEGHYPLASYSLLYYEPAALVGNLPLVLAAAIASAVLFVSIARREWGDAARWPSRAFGVCAAAPLFTGLYSSSLGLPALLGTVRALQARRTLLAVVLAALTLGFSPLAFGFLCLVLVAIVTARRRITVSSVTIAVAVCAFGAFELVVQRLFPTKGVYPFHVANLLAVVAVSMLGALLARRAGGAVITAFFVLWGAGSIVAALISCPVR